MSHFPVSLPVSHPLPSLSLSLSGWSSTVRPPTFSSFFVSSSLFPLFPFLSLLCVSRWPNRQICSFSTGLWIPHNRPQILSPDSVLPGWEAKQREEGGEEMKWFWRVVQGRELNFKEFLECLHMASCVSL